MAPSPKYVKPSYNLRHCLYSEQFLPLYFAVYRVVLIEFRQIHLILQSIDIVKERRNNSAIKTAQKRKFLPEYITRTCRKTCEEWEHGKNLHWKNDITSIAWMQKYSISKLTRITLFKFHTTCVTTTLLNHLKASSPHSVEESAYTCRWDIYSNPFLLQQLSQVNWQTAFAGPENTQLGWDLASLQATSFSFLLYS
jgi:hypothetical protein